MNEEENQQPQEELREPYYQQRPEDLEQPQHPNQPQETLPTGEYYLNLCDCEDYIESITEDIIKGTVNLDILYGVITLKCGNNTENHSMSCKVELNRSRQTHSITFLCNFVTHKLDHIRNEMNEYILKQNENAVENYSFYRSLLSLLEKVGQNNNSKDLMQLLLHIPRSIIQDSKDIMSYLELYETEDEDFIILLLSYGANINFPKRASLKYRNMKKYFCDKELDYRDSLGVISNRKRTFKKIFMKKNELASDTIEKIVMRMT